MDSEPKRKRRHLKVVRPFKNKVPPGVFIETLVMMLDLARRGKIRGYALTFIVDDGETKIHTSEAADVIDRADAFKMLGAMRRMEHRFMRDEFPEHDDARL